MRNLLSKAAEYAARLWNHLDAKVRAPFVSALAATAIEWLSTGTFNTVEITTTGTAVLMAAIGYVVPNLSSRLRAEGELEEPPGDVAGL